VKAVFDTNVLIAAFLTDGICSKLFVRVRKKEYELILSLEIIQEFETVLLRKFSLSQADLSDVRSLLREVTTDVLGDVGPITSVCRDPDDDKILACAAKAGANYIVTGDEDLLIIGLYREISIVRPRDFEALFPD
jgi:uncharacterized protein